jgi:hypothetical protein
MIKNHQINFPPIYIAALLAVILFSTAGAYLEYNFILLDGLPYREAQLPALGFLYVHDLVFFVPMLLLLAFTPTIYFKLSKQPLKGQTLRRNFALGLGSAMIGLILRDACWFLIRTVAPIASDPLAYQWIKPSDYTASFIGSVQLGATIPLWYVAFLPPIIATLISLMITSPESVSK